MQPSVESEPADRIGFDPVPSTPAIALILGLTAGVVLTWTVPLLAVVLVWPWLFLVPGWILVRRTAPDLPRAGVVGVGVVASVYLSAHVVALVSAIDGFGRIAVILTAGLLVLATVVIARARHPWLAPWSPPAIRSWPTLVIAALREDAPAWIVASAVGLLILSILGSNGWRQTPDGIVSGGWNWSDLLVHVAIGNSIVHGNFPPEVPYFAGVPLTYHWFADFHGAIVATAAEVPIIAVFFLSSAVMAATLALVVWSLALVLTRDRRVATIATLLACVGGGMGWLRLGADILAGNPDIVGLVTHNPYDNSWADGWPYFRIASVLGTGLLPHRATTFGLPGLVSVVLLVAACLGRRPGGVLLAGVLAALLAPFHFHAFPATYLVVLLWVLFAGGWRRRTVWRDGLLFLAPIVLALPYVLPAAVQQGAVGAFHTVGGWSEARIGDGPGAVAFFYVTNLGIPTLLAIGTVLFLRGQRAVPQRGFLTAWLVALFLVPNLVVVSSVEFDMNKYFQMMWIAVAILGAWWVARWPRGAIVAVLAVCALSPALIALHHAWNPAVVLSPAQQAVADWIETDTPERAVFATDDFINSPVDLAGRLRITTFGPYVANLGYDPAPREEDIRTIYCGGPTTAAATMSRYRATYVLSNGGALDCPDGEPTDFASSGRFETVYAADGVSVWQLLGE
ncbi:MAG TPA: DUF2298 domain-containing protein [Candidatus Limnocylindrales bacterium]|nr:DUF2298 domain-containing protein [Candidatus Limnocylindrales bacterium]